MKLDRKKLERAAFEMYAKWARISDPKYAELRWNRMNTTTRERFIEEAEVAIRTYANLC